MVGREGPRVAEWFGRVGLRGRVGSTTRPQVVGGADGGEGGEGRRGQEVGMEGIFRCGAGSRHEWRVAE